MVVCEVFEIFFKKGGVIVCRLVCILLGVYYVDIRKMCLF